MHTPALLLKWDRCLANSVAEQFEHLLPWLPQLRLGLNITPWLVLLFITTRMGSANCRWRHAALLFERGLFVSHSQSTEPSPASGLTVK